MKPRSECEMQAGARSGGGFVSRPFLHVFSRSANKFLNWLPRQRRARLTLSTLLVIAGSVILFYQVENWRGKRAWAVCLRESERKGRTLEIDKLVPVQPRAVDTIRKPPSISDVLKLSTLDELSEAVCMDALFKRPERAGLLVAEVTLPSADTELLPPDFDLVLNYARKTVSVDVQSPRDDSKEEMIPLIVADEVPLADMVRNLARQAQLNYMLDSSISSEWVRAHAQPCVSLRWENITPRQALADLLASYDLEYVVEPRTQIARIVRRTVRPGNVQANWQTEEQVGAILSRFAGSEPKGAGVQSLPSVTGAFVLFSATPGDVPGPSIRARILLRTEEDLDAKDVRNLLQAAAWNTFTDVRRLQVTSREEDVFQVFVNPPQFYEARHYLALTERFERRLEALRQELSTPMPRMEIDYPFRKDRSLPNFGPLRIVAQTLAQRAQAHLLSGDPAAALGEIRLCQDLGERLTHPVAGGPVPLVAAMMHVAVTQLAATTVSEGFALGKWREPELCELQEMLSKIHLGPAVAGALSLERAIMCGALETSSPKDYSQMLAQYTGAYYTDSRWEPWRSPVYWFMKIAPRGWVYQNMASCAALNSPQVDAYDSRAHKLDSRMLNDSVRHAIALRDGFHPYSWLAGQAASCFVKAWETTARTQSLLNQAFIACALERYQAMHGCYPGTLEELVPLYAAKLPHDLLTGQPPFYALKQGGGFSLYSVGWETAVNGVCENQRASGSDVNWVWPPSASDAQ